LQTDRKKRYYLQMELEQTAIKATSKSSNRLDTDYNNVLEKAKQRGLEQVYEIFKGFIT
jgi:hypothetical protein